MKALVRGGAGVIGSNLVWALVGRAADAFAALREQKRRVQRVGYRVKAITLADEMDLAGIIQDRPDRSVGSVLVIAEGKKKDESEWFASAIAVKNAFIHADNVDAQYSQGSGQHSACLLYTSDAADE